MVLAVTKCDTQVVYCRSVSLNANCYVEVDIFCVCFKEAMFSPSERLIVLHGERGSVCSEASRCNSVCRLLDLGRCVLIYVSTAHSMLRVHLNVLAAGEGSLSRATTQCRWLSLCFCLSIP
jgi:hypothetical protein